MRTGATTVGSHRPTARVHVKARIAEGGGLPMPMTPAEFGQFTLDDIEKWRKVVRAANIKVG